MITYFIEYKELEEYASKNNWLKLMEDTNTIKGTKYTLYQVQDHIYKYYFEYGALKKVKEI